MESIHSRELEAVASSVVELLKQVKLPDDLFNAVMGALAKKPKSYQLRCYLQALELVRSVDSDISRLALRYISQYGGVSIRQALLIFIAKKLAQIQFGINDPEDSYVDLFGWLLLLRTVE